MTREEAIAEIKYYMEHDSYADAPSNEACQMAINALRPVSREMVEKVWKGEWIVQHGDLSGFIKKCSKCGFLMSVWLGPDKFCANCGAPMTDVAVQMVMGRINELHD